LEAREGFVKIHQMRRRKKMYQVPRKTVKICRVMLSETDFCVEFRLKFFRFASKFLNIIQIVMKTEDGKQKRFQECQLSNIATNALTRTSSSSLPSYTFPAIATSCAFETKTKLRLLPSSYVKTHQVLVHGVLVVEHRHSFAKLS
jgi:hypothetical protein